MKDETNRINEHSFIKLYAETEISDCDQKLLLLRSKF